MPKSRLPRVAKERGVSEEVVRAEVTKATDNPLLGIGGDPGVNVLKVNLALDALTPKGAPGRKKTIDSCLRPVGFCATDRQFERRERPQ